MSSNFRPEPQDAFYSYDRDLHEYQESVGSDCAGYDAYLDGVDEDEYYDDDEYDYEDDGPSEYTEWMDFDPDC
jgi:hypothetical protein